MHFAVLSMKIEHIFTMWSLLFVGWYPYLLTQLSQISLEHLIEVTSSLGCEVRRSGLKGPLGQLCHWNLYNLIRIYFHWEWWCFLSLVRYGNVPFNGRFVYIRVVWWCNLLAFGSWTCSIQTRRLLLRPFSGHLGLPASLLQTEGYCGSWVGWMLN